MSYFNPPIGCYFVMMVCAYGAHVVCLNGLAALADQKGTAGLDLPNYSTNPIERSPRLAEYDPGQVGQPTQTGGSGGRWVAAISVG